MIVHKGVRYWTTQELAASLVARGLIARNGSRREALRRARRWAARGDLRPMATTKRGELLWAEDATLAILGESELTGADGPAILIG